MSCEVGERTLPLYLEGALDPAAAARFEAHLRTCAGCADLLQLWRQLGDLPEPAVPSALMRARLNAALPPRHRSHFAVPQWAGWAAAAVVLLCAGLALGRWSAQPSGDVAQLRQEVRSLQTLVAIGLLNQQSAGERLKGVDYAGRLGDGSRDVVTALIGSLRYDSNVNVRLAACDALRRYAPRDPVIRRAFAEALAAEDSPLVKVAVIDALADLRDRNSVDPLTRLSNAAGEEAVVRERAVRALQQIKTRSTL